jgi:hypothetical protein
MPDLTGGAKGCCSRNHAESAEIMPTTVAGEVAINLSINNRAGGNAPWFFQVISEKFLMQQQFTPMKQMDLW